MKIFQIILFFGISIIPLTAKPLAVTTTTMITDLVGNIASGHIEVEGLMPAGADPHTYRPTARDAAKLRKADIIFYNGLHLEGRMTELLEQISRQGKEVHAITKNTQNKDLIFDNNTPDPHIWFDILIWSNCIDSIVTKLSQTLPEKRAIFEKNAHSLKKRYKALDLWVFDQISKIKPEKRLLVTSHDAFSYMGRRYGLKVISVQGISTLSEAGLSDIVETIDIIKKHKIPAIFIESSVSKNAIVRISQDSGAKIGGELFSDSTGPLGLLETDLSGKTYDLGTYEGVIRHNINTIVKALM